jgi:hypothetical protein
LGALWANQPDHWLTNAPSRFGREHFEKSESLGYPTRGRAGMSQLEGM